MNHQHNLHKGIQDLKKTSLSREEKGMMLSYLMDHIQKSPLPAYEAPPTWYSGFFTYKQYQIAYTSILLIAILIVGGNISYAAEQALPGDLLYPIKLHLNEKVQDVLTFTPEAKIAWEETKVEKRLKEAEILITQGAFDEPKRVQIEHEVEKNVQNLRKQNKKDSERVKNIYVQFRNKNRTIQAVDVDEKKHGVELPRIIVSTSTLKAIQTTKNKRNSNTPFIAKQATTSSSSDLIVQIKVENQEVNQKIHQNIDEKRKEAEKEIERFQENLQHTLRDALEDINLDTEPIFNR